MTTTTTQITDAIERSISHTEIVTVRVDAEDWDAASEALIIESDDHVEDGSDGEGTLDAWGADEDGCTWRVLLVRCDETCEACGGEGWEEDVPCRFCGDD